MRRAAIVVSLIAHLAAAWWLAPRRAHVAVPAVAVRDVPPLVVDNVDAVELVLMPATTREVSGSGTRPNDATRAKTTEASIGTSNTTTTAEASTATTNEPAAGTTNATAANEGAPTLNLALAPAVAERIAGGGRPGALPAPANAIDAIAGGSGTARPLRTPSDPIESVAGGRGVVRTTVTTMHVAADGSAHFVDDKDFRFTLEVPSPDPGTGIREPERHAPVACEESPVSRAGGLVASDPGADVACWDGTPLPRGSLGSGVIAKVDVTSWLQRRLVGDPYASTKLKLLDDTREERAARGAAYRSEQLARSAELMTRALEALWRAESDPARRRQALFELWDDCAEGDEEAGAAGERARAIVIGWIRARLPAGSPEAYSDEEVRALGARRHSKQPFTPY